MCLQLLTILYASIPKEATNAWLFRKPLMNRQSYAQA